MLEDKNVKIQGELQYWNDLYSQETGTTPLAVTSSVSINVLTSTLLPLGN